jgi:hypothetical protein
MIDDISGIERAVAGYDKNADEDGEQSLIIEYKLKPIKLAFLRELFNIDPNDPDPVNRDLVYCYEINEDQANALQPYVIDGVIDLEKYDFMLECYQAD